MIVSRSGKLGTWASYVRPLAILLPIDILVVVAYVFAGWTWLSLPDVPLSIFGGVIGVIAGFRNASAYARWWEARIIWGTVVNSSRNFAREVLTMIAAPEFDPESRSEVSEVQRKLILLHVAYVHALRHHLRATPPWADLASLVPEQELTGLRAQSNVPLAIQQKIGCILSECYRQGWIDGIRWASLDRTLGALMDAQGASERIKNTPMPRVYDLFIRVIIDIFCLLLPLGMVDKLGLWTPLGSTAVGFIFLALDTIGRDLEAPFERLPHDVPLTTISRSIEINLRQMLGDKDVPQPLVPVDGILW